MTTIKTPRQNPVSTLLAIAAIFLAIAIAGMCSSCATPSLMQPDPTYKQVAWSTYETVWYWDGKPGDSQIKTKDNYLHIPFTIDDYIIVPLHECLVKRP